MNRYPVVYGVYPPNCNPLHCATRFYRSADDARRHCPHGWRVIEWPAIDRITDMRDGGWREVTK